MNIWYTNSTSVITSITSLVEVFIISTTGTVNSSMFIDFLSRLISFIEKNEETQIKNCLIIIDNATTHWSNQTIQYWESNGLNVTYIPAYTPELSPVDIFLKVKVCCNLKIKIKNAELAVKRCTEFDRRLDFNYIKKWYKKIMDNICKWNKIFNKVQKWIHLIIINTKIIILIESTSQYKFIKIRVGAISKIKGQWFPIDYSLDNHQKWSRITEIKSKLV